MHSMRLIGTTLALLLLGLPAAAETPDVAAAPPLGPQTQNGIEFVTGGVGDAQQQKLRALESDYNVRIALTRSDGAYLSDVAVVIEDAEGKSLIETTTRGPVLLAELDPGRYVLEASAAGRETERRQIDVPRERDQVRLYVALPDTSGEAGKNESKK